jgi:hypothetical protein
MKIHLDTDLGGDPDDACALALLLGLPGVELVGVTTSTDSGGARAGYVAHVLALAGRTGVPVAAGAGASLTTGEVAEPDATLWPGGAAARPAPPLRAADLPRLRRCGPLGDLLAAQSEAYAAGSGKADLGSRYAGLPDDLLNFHYDPVACALAVGWDGGRVERRRLRTVERDGVLRFADEPAGRPVDVLVDMDGAAFTEAWLAAVAVAGGRR